jgi:TatD DNase family protein
MWIDSHAHLYDLDDQALSLAMQACIAAGVSFVLNTGTSIDTSRKSLAQCNKYKNLGAVVGISPFDAASIPESWDMHLEGILSDEHVMAIGETGLDATNPGYPDIGLQLPLLETHLELARKHDLPVVLHSRGSEERVARLCMERGVKKAMFHCFTGDLAALKTLLDGGYYVSFSGIITFANSPVRTCVEYAPLDRILIETDSPYLAPIPFRGKKNQPAWAAQVGKKVAEIKKLDEEETARAITENFKRLFSALPII